MSRLTRTQNHQTLEDAPLHVAIELCLIVFLVVLVVTRRKESKSALGQPDLDPNTVQELCDDWVPEPLASSANAEFEGQFPRAPIVER